MQTSRIASDAGTVVSVSRTLKNINLNIFNKIFNLCPGALWLFYGEGVPVRLDRFNCHSDWRLRANLVNFFHFFFLLRHLVLIHIVCVRRRISRTRLFTLKTMISPFLFSLLGNLSIYCKIGELSLTGVFSGRARFISVRCFVYFSQREQ